MSKNKKPRLDRVEQLTISQIVYSNELSFGYTDDDIHEKIGKIWQVMDDCIRTFFPNVSASTDER